jgi:spermidine synthase
VYAAGLVGACVGVLVWAGWMIPSVGTEHASVIAASVNLLVAWLAGTWLPDAKNTAEEITNKVPVDATMSFAASGIFGLGAQVVWNRTIVPYTGVSTFAFACIVAVYVASQALGFAAIRRVRDRALVGRLALACAPALALVCLALCSIAQSLTGSRDGSSLSWALGTLVATVLLVAPVSVLLGIAQAAALDTLESHSQRSHAAALTTGLGTLAAALASVLASLWLVPTLGPRWTLFVLSLPCMAVLFRSGISRAAMATVVTAMLCATAPGPRYFLGSEYDKAEVLFAHVGVQDTAAVVRYHLPVEPGVRHLVAAGVSYSGDSLFAQRYMRLLAHLPALATTGRSRALVICIGTGTTLDALRLHGFSTVDAVDIDPSIRETLRYFSRAHHNAPDDPNVRVHIQDGDRFLALIPRATYDVITLEPPPPRAPGASTLYAKEFYEHAKRALRTGGVVAQWLPLHDMGGDEASSLVATFLSVFPNASLHLAERNEAILLSEHAVTTLQVRDAAQQDLAHIGINSFNALNDTFWADNTTLANITRNAPLVTRAWPGPELVPLVSVGEPLSTWVERVARDATPVARSYAFSMGPVVGAFLRVRAHAAQPNDMQRFTQVMRDLLQRNPGDSYVQYTHGFGAYLTERLPDLAREGVESSLLERATQRITRAEQTQR